MQTHRLLESCWSLMGGSNHIISDKLFDLSMYKCDHNGLSALAPCFQIINQLYVRVDIVYYVEGSLSMEQRRLWWPVAGGFSTDYWERVALLAIPSTRENHCSILVVICDKR